MLREKPHVTEVLPQGSLVSVPTQTWVQGLPSRKGELTMLVIPLSATQKLVTETRWSTRLTHALGVCRSATLPLKPGHDGKVGNAIERGWALLFPWIPEQGHPYFSPTPEIDSPDRNPSWAFCLR